MSLTIVCTKCGARLKAEKLPRTGKVLSCPKCHNTFTYAPSAAVAGVPVAQPVPAHIPVAWPAPPLEADSMASAPGVGRKLLPLVVGLVIVVVLVGAVVKFKGKDTGKSGTGNASSAQQSTATGEGNTTNPANPAAEASSAGDAGNETKTLELEETAYFPKRHATVHYNNGQPHGEVRAYDDHDRLIVVEPYVQGVLQGERITYYPSGKKFGSLRFENGKAQGVNTVWYEDGTVAWETEMKDGTLDGKHIGYFPNGNKALESTNSAGVAHGERRHFLPSGRLFGITQWANGQEIGRQILVEPTQADFRAIQAQSQFSSTLKDHWRGAPATVAESPKAVESPRATSRPKVPVTTTGGAWQSLFNGQDLTGWTGAKGVWQVKDGAIYATSGVKGRNQNTFLACDQEFKDFELELDARVHGNNNSGVMIRSELYDTSNYFLKGVKLDLGKSRDTNWGALVTYSGRGGSILKRAPAGEVQNVVHLDEFNRVRIRCVGKHVTVHVNDQEFQDEELSQLEPTGTIGFQLRYGNPVEVSFKNIRIRTVE